MTKYPNPYYAASAKRTVDYPALQENISTDICVVGGGYSGLSTAITLREKGYKVVLLEAVNIGFGVFAGLPHYNFPSGRIMRVPMTMMGAWYYGLRDKFGL